MSEQEIIKLYIRLASLLKKQVAIAAEIDNVRQLLKSFGESS